LQQAQASCFICSRHGYSICSAGAPICINTVLWNTIKLLFPKHAASAPDSPADAIFTPASANRAAVVANAVADLPMRRGLARVPFIPPRSLIPYKLLSHILTALFIVTQDPVSLMPRHAASKHAQDAAKCFVRSSMHGACLDFHAYHQALLSMLCLMLFDFFRLSLCLCMCAC